MQTTAGRPKDLEKHQQILAAAKALFLTHGYHGSSMNQIAKQAGVTKLTIYNHFKDKENLFSCAIAATCEESIAARSLTLNADCDFQQAFFHVCELALNMVNLPEALKLEHLLLELAAEQNPLVHQFYNASHQRMYLVWQDFFQQAIQLKFIQVAEIEKQTNLILSLLLGTRHHEVLLGIRTPPTITEKRQIILDSIQLFLLKYNTTSQYSNAK